MSKLINAITAASMGAGILICSAAFAGRDAGAEGPGPGWHGPRGGAFMHELRDLNLTDAQKQQIHGFFDAKREQGKASREAMHALHKQFDLATPGTPAYAALTTQMADAEAAQARERTIEMSDMRTQVYGVLTDAQRKQLAQEIASRPQPPAPPQ